MANSTLRVDTIQDRFGTGPVNFLDQEAAKATLHYNPGASSIQSSLNISSVSNNSNGDDTVNYNNAFTSDDNKVPNPSSRINSQTPLISGTYNATVSAGADRITTSDDTGTNSVSSRLFLITTGTLA